MRAIFDKLSDSYAKYYSLNIQNPVALQPYRALADRAAAAVQWS